MAERKMAVLFVMITVLVVGALEPAASADTCMDECHKECEKKSKNDVDAGSCSKLCGGKCALKAYAAATPAEVAAKVASFEKGSADARYTAVASTPGFEKLNAGCARECKKKDCGSGAGKKKKEEEDEQACNMRCDDECRDKAVGLAINGTAYTEFGAKDKEAVIQTIDKHASGRKNKMEALAAPCVEDRRKFCDKDPECDAICDNGCRSRAVKVALSLATPAQKEAINKDMQATAGPAPA